MFVLADERLAAQVRLLLLAALCGEHLLLLGPPGTAKSELVSPCVVCSVARPSHALCRTQGRRLSKLCKGTFFERLLTRFSVPEVRAASDALACCSLLRRCSLRCTQELFGPLSLRALEQDLYVRQTKGYLPDASVAFIDEARHAVSRQPAVLHADASVAGVQSQLGGAELAADDIERAVV